MSNIEKQEWNRLVAERLRTAMAESGLNAADLARASGVSQSDISNYLNCKYRPRQAKVYALARALNVSPSYLWALDAFSGSGAETKPEEPTETVETILQGISEEEKTLFRLARNAKPEAIKAAVAVLKSMEETNPDF